MGKVGSFGGKVLENSMRKTVLSRMCQNFSCGSLCVPDVTSRSGGVRNGT